MSKELDEQVAVEVMGWEKRTSNPPHNKDFWVVGRGRWVYIWSPSTKMKNAYEVLEKLEVKDGFKLQKYNHEEWVAYGDHEDFLDGSQVRGKTPMEAICRYALEVVRNKK